MAMEADWERTASNNLKRYGYVVIWPPPPSSSPPRPRHLQLSRTVPLFSLLTQAHYI